MQNQKKILLNPWRRWSPLSYVLASKGITNLELLAEQGTDDLEGIEELNEEKAGQLIMAARNIVWFSEEQ